MVKGRKIKPVNFREEDFDILEKHEAVLKTRGQDFSEWVREGMKKDVERTEREDKVTLESWVEDPDAVAGGSVFTTTIANLMKTGVSDKELEELSFEDLAKLHWFLSELVLNGTGLVLKKTGHGFDLDDIAKGLRKPWERKK